MISLELSNSVAEHIIPKDYVKPDIVVGNYYLKWDESSYGIPHREASQLRQLIQDLLPYFSTAIYEAAKEIHLTIEENSKGPVSRHIEGFSPELLLTHRRGDVIYNLQMKHDGAALLRRSETVRVGNNSNIKGRVLAITWILGELLFNRQRYT